VTETKPSSPGRPRLLVLASTFPSHPNDGTPHFVLDLARIQARSFDTVVIVPRVPGSAPVERIDGVEVRRFRYFPRRWEGLAHGAIIENLRGRRSNWLQVLPFFIAEILAIRRAVRELHPDVLHVHWIIPQGLSALVAARRVPWLVTTLGGDLYALTDPLSTRLKRAVLRRARAATAMNTQMCEMLLTLGAPAQRTQVLSMGAQVDRIRDGAAHVHTTPGRLLFAGRLVEKKGVEVLLRALRLLPDNLEWSLRVVGDGPLRADLERAAAGLPVRFLGQLGLAELAEEYGTSEVIVLPSVRAASGDQDGLPVVLIEAMAAGRAVVASALSGIDAAISDGHSGLLVPPGDPTALADALTQLLTDASLRERLGENARSRADEFSVEAVGERYVSLLRDIAGAPDR
jgi:Glycosyltransferase